MPTLLLFSQMTPDCKALWFAARRAGWETERLSGLPLRNLVGKEVVLYGEPFYATLLAEVLGLALLEPTLDWLACLPWVYLLREVRFTALVEARTVSCPRFIKPADETSFPAQVYASGSDLPCPERLSDSTPVLLSEPVTWEVEYRCFVRDRQVLTCSPYLRNGQLARTEDGQWPAPADEQDKAFSFASGLLNDSGVSVPPSFVLDIGKVVGRGWAVVEANPAFGSGIYGCEAERVLRVVERTSVRKECLGEQERAWVIPRRFDPRLFEVLGVEPTSEAPKG